MTIERAPTTALELQLRRCVTRAEFLRLELDKLDDLVAAGAAMSDDQAHALAAPIERVGDLIVRLVRRHADA